MWDGRARSNSAPRAGYSAVLDEELRPILPDRRGFRRNPSSDEFRKEFRALDEIRIGIKDVAPLRGMEVGGPNTHGGSGQGAAAGTNKPLIKSGRQRKKQAVRTKGGEFQARRRKRRLYFCSISSEIDVERMFEEVGPGFDEGEVGAWQRNLYTNVLHLYLPALTVGGSAETEEPFRYGSFDAADPSSPRPATEEGRQGRDGRGSRGGGGARGPVVSGSSPASQSHSQKQQPLLAGRSATAPAVLCEKGTPVGGLLLPENDFTTDADSSVELQAMPARPHRSHLLPLSATNEKPASLYEDDDEDAALSSAEPPTPTVSPRVPATLPDSASHAHSSSSGNPARGPAEFPLTSEQSAAGYKEVFVFDFGAIVFWGFSLGEEEGLLSYIRSFTLVEDKLSLEEFEKGEDDMAFVISPDSVGISITNDVFSLPEDTTVKQRLAISFASAQSSVLAIHEARIEKKVNDFRYIPESFARDGHLRLSSKKLGKMIGDVFVIRHDVNLHTEILDTPEFFWGNEAVVHLYKLTYDYLEMAGRTEILNKRLDMLKQLLSMLQQQNEAEHNVKLEWIIIILIIVSVVLEFLSVGGKALGLWN